MNVNELFVICFGCYAVIRLAGFVLYNKEETGILQERCVLQLDLALPHGRGNAELLNHVCPSTASPLFELHILEQLLSLVDQDPQVSLIMLILVSSVLFEDRGQVSNLCRQDGNLDLRGARIGPSPRRHGHRVRRNGQRLLRNDLIGILAAKLIHDTAHVDVESVLGAAVA